MSKEKRGSGLFLYAGVFLCFTAMYFFIVPQSDVFLFARDTQPTVAGVLDGAFTYGNGRFLGNCIGMFLSHYFILAFLPVALCLTAFVWLVNRLVFSGSVKTILPIAFLVAFPSWKMLGECYYLFAAFANYVLPIFFVLLSVLLLKTLGEKKVPTPARIVMNLLLFVSSAAAALFSENTTVVLLTFAVLWIAAEILRKHRITFHGVCGLLGAGVGALCMLAVPILSQTSYKMDHYRGVATGSISEMAHNVMAAFIRFSGVMNSLTLVITALSLGFLLVLRGKEKRPAYLFAKSVFAVYPLFSMLMSFADDIYLYIPVIETVQVVPVLCYAAAIVIGVSALPDKQSRQRGAGYVILLLSSVGPMLLVTQYGYRTFYTTFVILLVWALELLMQNRSALQSMLKKWKLDLGKVTAVLACAFVFFSGFLFVQSVINYDFFAVRTAYLAEQLDQGAAETTVPLLPCQALTIEDDWPNILRDILPDKSAIRIKPTTDVSLCENHADYESLYSGSPVYPFTFALQHLGYKNPRNVHAQF